MKKGIAVLLIVVGVLLAAVLAVFGWMQAEQVSIGIIGGADGPTTIFVSGPEDGSLWLLGAGALLIAGGIGGWLWMRRRR